MRRKDKEIQSLEDRLAIIKKCKICRIALCTDNQPYIVPMNYGCLYSDSGLTLYFHSAKAGKKVEMIKQNNKACFEIDSDTELIVGEKACKYGYQFKSIIGFGEITIVESNDEKIRGLNLIMKHQTGNDREYIFEDNDLEHVLVLKLKVDEFTGKEKII